MSNEKMECPDCESKECTRLEEEQTDSLGPADLKLDISYTYKFPVFRCSRCSFEWTDHEKEQVADKARATAVEKRLVELNRQVSTMNRLLDHAIPINLERIFELSKNSEDARTRCRALGALPLTRDVNSMTQEQREAVAYALGAETAYDCVVHDAMPLLMVEVLRHRRHADTLTEKLVAAINSVKHEPPTNDTEASFDDGLSAAIQAVQWVMGQNVDPVVSLEHGTQDRQSGS